MAFDLITGDDQYQLGSLLMGSAGLMIGQPGVSGWEGLSVSGPSTRLDMADGEIIGADTAGALTVTIPLVVIRDTEAQARSDLAGVLAAWKPPAPSVAQDMTLHRQVAGVVEYVVGRSRGCAVEMRHVKSGVVPVLCSFRVPVPVVYMEDGS